MSSTDKIVKTVVLKAPHDRVWHAIADSKQFGTWFGVELDRPFAAGATITGRITPTKVDPEVAKLQEPHAGSPFTIEVASIDPQRLFSFKWHPFAVDPKFDYSQEPMTLVEFALDDVDGGVRLTITESGFDRIPLERRAKAFQSNADGWAHQCKLIEKYLAR